MNNSCIEAVQLFDQGSWSSGAHLMPRLFFPTLFKATRKRVRCPLQTSLHGVSTPTNRRPPRWSCGSLVSPASSKIGRPVTDAGGNSFVLRKKLDGTIFDQTVERTELQQYQTLPAITLRPRTKNVGQEQEPRCWHRVETTAEPLVAVPIACRTLGDGWWSNV